MHTVKAMKDCFRDFLKSNYFLNLIEELQKNELLENVKQRHPSILSYGPKLFNDPERMKYFKQYLGKQHSEENFDFYVSVESYEVLETEDKRKRFAIQLIDTFIKEESSKCINIRHSPRQRILMKHQEEQYPPDRLFFLRISFSIFRS